MGYHTNLYLLVFLPAVLLLYQLTPRKFRPYTLLAASYAYFFVMSRMLFLVLLFHGQHHQFSFGRW